MYFVLGSNDLLKNLFQDSRGQAWVGPMLSRRGGVNFFQGGGVLLLFHIETKNL